MSRAPRHPSCPTAARLLSALVVLALITVAQLAHWPAAHAHDASATHVMDPLDGRTGLPAADAPPAMHDAADCAGPGCGACVAAFTALSGGPDRVRGPLHHALVFDMTLQPPELPFRPPTHLV